MGEPRTLSGLVTCLLLLGAVFYWLWSIIDYLDNLSYFEETGFLRYQRWLQVCAAGVVVGWSAGGAARNNITGFLLRFKSAFPVRLALYGVCLAILATSVFVGIGLLPRSGAPTSAFFHSIVGLILVAWYYLVVRFAHSFTRVPNAASRYVDIVLINIVVSAFAIEFVLRQAASWAPGPFLYDSSSLVARIKAHRFKPGAQYFDFRHNSLGYYDDEFFVATENDFVVAVISDSFGQGVVPHSFNFTTVAEKVLKERLAGKYQRIAVNNFGVAGIGMREYLYILENDVLPTNPELVIVAVFVGNDIVDRPEENSWKVFQAWWLFELPRRYLLASREDETYWNPNVPTGIPPYINDPTQERPTFSKKNYLTVERTRAVVSDKDSPAVAGEFDRFFQILDRLALKAEGRIIVAIVPDEYQVNDTLYREVLASMSDPESLGRDYPQKRIAEYCRANGLDYLDLLPVLRKANLEERVYHLRNTHWNARGNRIAGQAIAEHVLSRRP